MDLKVDKYLMDLNRLLAGTVMASHIIGKGYCNPISVASAWLRMQIHNLENPNSNIHYIGVTSNGKAYKTVNSAMKSKAYQSLVDGTFKVLNNSNVVDYGVIASRYGDGYEVYACLG